VGAVIEVDRPREPGQNGALPSLQIKDVPDSPPLLGAPAAGLLQRRQAASLDLACS